MFKTISSHGKAYYIKQYLDIDFVAKEVNVDRQVEHNENIKF